MKLRIIKIIPEVSEYNIDQSNIRNFSYVIEKKTIWGWKEIFNNEHPFLTKRIYHDSYELAENYMFQNYFKNGNVYQNGNVYTNTKYTYSI